jgi:hypothetical protein
MLKLKTTYFLTQNCLIYTGKMEGKIKDKHKLYLGKLRDLPTFPPNKRFNIRVRGSDSEGNRYKPLQCKGRTDSAGDLYIHPRYKPEIDQDASIEPDNPHQPQMPKPNHLALVINNTIYGRKRSD